MELLIFWITTMIISFIIRVKTVRTLIKDINDSGYKLDINKLIEFKDRMGNLSSNLSTVNFLKFVTPFLNIISEIEFSMNYYNMRDSVLQQLNLLNLLVPMTDEEKRQYKSNSKDLLNAISNDEELEQNIVLLKDALKCLKHINEYAQYSYIKIENSTVYYEYKNGILTIIKAIGTFSLLPIEEQKSRLMEKLIEMGIILKEEKTSNADSEDCNLCVNKKEENTTENSDAQKEQLKKWKEKLIDDGKKDNKPKQKRK